MSGVPVPGVRPLPRSDVILSLLFLGDVAAGMA